MVEHIDLMVDTVAAAPETADSEIRMLAAAVQSMEISPAEVGSVEVETLAKRRTGQS